MQCSSRIAERVRRAALVTALVLGSGSARAGDEDCQSCHADRTLTADDGRSVFVDEAEKAASIHGALACADCHDGKEDFPHRKGTSGAATCASCHEDAVAEHAKSIHAAPVAAGDGATCRSCHGAAHGMRPASDPLSTIARKSLPETCGACHANPAFVEKHGKGGLARPVEAYRLSVHGRSVEAGRGGASCSDCHGTHGIVPARDAAARINHGNVVQTCGGCHKEAAAAFKDSVHGKAAAAGVREAPVCTDCHGEHGLLAPSEPGSLVNPARVSSATCARCHADERLTAKFNLPRDQVPAFDESYHGLALRSGQQRVANCASCHGVHNILPSSDPRSTVNAANLARTCGQCHSGAGQRFALGPVHVVSGGALEHTSVRTVRWAYWLLIPLTLGFMLLHNALDLLAKARRGSPAHHDGPELPRMSRPFRVAHVMTMVSFSVLVVTGFALKFPEAWWARPLLAWEGELELRALVHRIAGVILLLALAYHAAHLLLVRADRRVMRHIVPAWQDLRDLVAALKFSAGLSRTRPRFGVFSYAEKAEYWAYLWGTLVMAVTGFWLWFDDAALAYFPKWMSDLATSIHYYEAILATGAILIWHIYAVVFDPDVYPMERTWLTGTAPAERFRESRPAYYRALMRRLRHERD
jgi:formate dehydrogenase gamma subunit